MKRFSSPIVAFVVLSVAAILGFGAVQSHMKHDLQSAQIRNCENSKQDRVENARAWTAHVHYVEEVLDAASVKGDVKRAARTAIQFESETANQLRARLYKCRPLIIKNDKIIDERDLREARGEL